MSLMLVVIPCLLHDDELQSIWTWNLSVTNNNEIRTEPRQTLSESHFKQLKTFQFETFRFLFTIITWQYKINQNAKLLLNS